MELSRRSFLRLAAAAGALAGPLGALRWPGRRGRRGVPAYIADASTTGHLVHLDGLPRAGDAVLAYAPPPPPSPSAAGTGPRWVMVIDLAKCNGCREYTMACNRFHFVPPGQEWIKVYANEDNETAGPYWFPRPCMQCDDPPCVKVCPVSATYKREDGIVIQDLERCIGCRFCIPAVVDGFGYGNTLRLAASVEKTSEHPLAQAIVEAAEERGLTLAAATAFQAVPGHGVEGTVDGHRVLLGNVKLMRDHQIDVGTLEAEARRLADEGKTPMYLAVDGIAAAVIAVADTVKPDSAQVIVALKKMGIDVAMITGDNERTARAIARRVGIERVLAEVLPQEAHCRTGGGRPRAPNTAADMPSGLALVALHDFLTGRGRLAPNTSEGLIAIHRRICQALGVASTLACGMPPEAHRRRAPRPRAWGS